MSRLIGKGHRNPWSAALSIAANRASKVALLRREGHEGIAERFEQHLRDDVAGFLAEHPDRPPRFAVAMREACGWDAAPDTRDTRMELQ